MQNQSNLKTVSVVIGSLILLTSSVVFLGAFDLVLPILLGICFVVYFIHRHTVPPLILLNLILISVTLLLFALGLGIGITEDYHPNAVARPLFPTVGILFIISVFSLITSLFAWFLWRRVTGKIVGVVVATFVLILGIAGITTYFLTETNPEIYTLEHRGFTYEIPRVYNPAYDPPSRESDHLKIEVCDENPSAPVYDDSHFSNRGFPCTAVTYRIEPADTVLRAPFASRWVREGKWGFTLATSSQGLVLTEYDETIAEDNFLERENAIDKTVIQSVPATSNNVSVKYDTVIYMEVVNDVLKWLTICGEYETCTSYEPLPDDPQYVIRTVAENRFYDDTGTVQNLVWKYKEHSKDALALFESFRVNEQKDAEIDSSIHQSGSEKTFTSEHLSATVHKEDPMTVTFRSSYKDLQRIYFGDGNVESLESSIQYTYYEAGLYEVKLTGNCDNAGPNEGCIEPDIDSMTVCVGQSTCSDPIANTTDYPPVVDDTYPYILTVEGPAATEFRVLSNEFEIGRFSSDGQFNYGHSVKLLRENIPNTVQVITDSPSTDIDISITRGDEIVCDPQTGTLTCTFAASPAYKLSVYNESEALPKCADAEFLSVFLSDLSPYQIAHFQNYFYIDIADLTSETPIFIEPDGSCTQNADLEFTHEAVFEAAYSPRKSLHVPFGSDRTVTLLFNESDIAEDTSVAIGDNPATSAYLLLSNEDDSRLIKLSGGARDVHLLLSKTR